MKNAFLSAKLRAEKLNISNCDFKVGSAIELPFEEDSFEQALIADILEHCEDDKAVIKECYKSIQTKW